MGVLMALIIVGTSIGCGYVVIDSERNGGEPKW